MTTTTRTLLTGFAVAAAVIVLFLAYQSTVVQQQPQPQQQHHHHQQQEPCPVADVFASFRTVDSSVAADDDDKLLSFHDFVTELVEHHTGGFSHGGFDLTALAVLAKAQASQRDTSAAGSVLPCRVDAAQEWKIEYRTSLPSGLSCLASFGGGISTTKTYISLGLARIAADEELAEMHDALQRAAAVAEEAREPRVLRAAHVALDEFRFATARMISAHIHHAISAAQTLFDAYRPEGVSDIVAEFVKAPIHGRAHSSKASSSSSSSTLHAPRRFRGVAAWLNRRIATSTASIFDTDLSAPPSTIFWKSKNVFPQHRERGVSGMLSRAIDPVEGKFWNILRSEVGCKSLERACENPEGCRYLCNREFMLRSGKKTGNSHFSPPPPPPPACPASARQNDTIAVLQAVFGGSDDASSSSTSAKEAACVRLVSYGSNNEFEFEDSVARLASSARAPLSGIATFDCTLAQGVKPSPTMKSLIGSGRFAFFPFCIGVADPELDVLRRRPGSAPLSARSPGKSVSLVELDPLLRSAFSSLNGNGGGARVSVLKMDIESFEFVAAPRWLQAELVFIGQQMLRSSNNKHQQQSVRFTSLPIVSVDQLQTEIHRRGHKDKRAAGVTGAMWLQWLLLNYHALGFAVVTTEKNPVDSCCYEAVLVNARYYIVSETWLAASTAS